MNKNELSKYFEQNMEKFLKFLGENVTIVKRNIGEGAFSVVHMIEEKIGSKMIQSALKVELIAEEGHTDSQKQTFIENQKKRVEKEAAIMQQLNECPNIVKYYSHIIRPVILNDKIEGYVCLLKMELLNPFSEAAKNISFTEQDVLKIAMDIGKGIQAAHKKGIIHRDIKPENFFVTDAGDYKLGDFNVSKEAATAHTFAGAHGYIAPEIYRAKTEIDKKYTCQADLYSFGICLYQFMNDMNFPFEGAECEADSALDIRMNGKKLPPPKHGSDDFKKIILKACEFETVDRYKTIDDLLVNLEQLIRHEEVIIPEHEEEAIIPDIPEVTPEIKHIPTEYAGKTPVTDKVSEPVRQADARVSTQTLIMIVCMVAVVLCIAALFVFILKDNKEPESKETQSILESETASETVLSAENNTGEDNYQAVCPACGNTISISSERFKTGRIFCPNCGQELIFGNNEEQDNSYDAESSVSQPSEITLLSKETAVSETVLTQTLSPETEPPQTTLPETVHPVIENEESAEFVDYGYADYEYSHERNAVCNTTSVHIYQTPDTNGPKNEAEMLYRDDVLTVYGEIDGYYYISTHAGDGTEFYGYVPKEYILYPVAAVDAGLNYAATEGYVKVKSCTLRSTPSQANDNNIVTYLYKDDTFTISDTANDYWYYINCNGYSGYVNHKMVTVY